MHGGSVRTGPNHPMGGSHPSDARGHPPMPPSGGYPADRLREEPRPYGEQLPGPYNSTPSGGYSDVLGAHHPPSRPEYGGPPPPDGWGSTGRQAPDQGQQGPYDPRAYPQDPYEGGYDNGRFH